MKPCSSVDDFLLFAEAFFLMFGTEVYPEVIAVCRVGWVTGAAAVWTIRAFVSNQNKNVKHKKD
jgi:hypothetical protein